MDTSKSGLGGRQINIIRSDWAIKKKYTKMINQKVTPPISFEQFKSYITLGVQSIKWTYDIFIIHMFTH